ncbi:iron chelate uptake ABC transporter family permease subunit, partial [Streptomyces sp. MBT57]|nr:iron chelate uptake ABC transporter family permease subunit [Streptomyces sp. MBT57]
MADPAQVLGEVVAAGAELLRASGLRCVGAGLAVIGTVLQALVRNQLADPFLLGVSSGASTG